MIEPAEGPFSHGISHLFSIQFQAICEWLHRLPKTPDRVSEWTSCRGLSDGTWIV